MNKAHIPFQISINILKLWLLLYNNNFLRYFKSKNKLPVPLNKREN